ncbi:MAG: sulfatase-like hydrolase/transferase, partial [Gemmatimonadetes bacterium]|nr:sulfatase-like hydrolase/transferase [Gemmatimonadota bacterium]
PEPFTLARLIKAQGYETALIGKWHLGLLPEFHPHRQGFGPFLPCHLERTKAAASGLSQAVAHRWRRHPEATTGLGIATA